MMALLIVGAGGKYSPLVTGGFGILEKRYRDGTCFKNIELYVFVAILVREGYLGVSRGI